MFEGVKIVACKDGGEGVSVSAWELKNYIFIARWFAYLLTRINNSLNSATPQPDIANIDELQNYFLPLK